MAYNVPWWDYKYKFRKQITLTANAGVVIPNPFLAKVDISGFTTNMRGDRNDVRIVRWQGGSLWSEKDIYRYNDTNFFFKTTDEVVAAATDPNYYIYYGYPDQTSVAPGSKKSVMPPYGDNQTNSLYYLDGDGQDYGDGLLTPETDLGNGGTITFPSAGFYVVAQGSGSGPSAFMFDATPAATAWGTNEHPFMNFQFYLNPSAGTGQIMNYWRAGGSGANNKIRIYTDGTNLYVEYVRTDVASSLWSVTIPSIITLGSFHHYAGAFDPSSGQLTIWKDGVIFGTYSAPSYPQSSAASTFPSLFAYFNGTSHESFLNGQLHGVKIGRHTKSELASSGFTFEHGKRSVLPTLTLGVEEQPSGGSFLYVFL